MQKLLYALLGMFILASCSKTTVKKENYDDGTVKSELTYKKIDGKEQLIKEIRFHPNGKKFFEGEYKNEKRDGYWASWFQDGTLWSEGEFLNGESHGKRTVYHANGNKYYEGNFTNGKRTGIWVFYSEDGKKEREIDYDKQPADSQQIIE
jgi:antitoxin component YwqK of YwqJK toxin-antitoxin module